MAAWNSLSPVLRGGLTAGALALAGLALWLWQGGRIAPSERADLAPAEVVERTAPGEVAPQTVLSEPQAGEATASAAEAAEATEPATLPAETDAQADTPVAEPAAAAVGEGAADPAAAGSARTEPGGDVPQPAAPPEFDVVRIEPGGASVIAGTAGPGDLVILMLDGSTIAETEADGRGAFVILTDIQPGPSPRVLTLLASGAAGERRSEASVIVAPAALPATKPAEEREGITPDETASQTVAMAAKEGQGEATEAASEEGTSQGMAGSGDEPDASEPELETAEGAAPRATPDMPAEDATPLDEAGAAASLASEAKGEEPEADGVAALPAPEAPAIAPAQALAPTAAPEAQAALPATDPQLLVTTGTGLRVLQPSASAAEVPLRVETIDYSQGGVTLSGRGTGGPSDLRIYLDNDPVAVAPLDTDGTWEAELEGVQPGTYTLRVDQLGGDGKVTGRFETPFLRESEEALARTAPADADAEGLAVSVITVQPGYSLWAIASDRYGDGMSWHKVLEANKGQIRDPDLIYPGQIFDLPE